MNENNTVIKQLFIKIFPALVIIAIIPDMGSVASSFVIGKFLPYTSMAAFNFFFPFNLLFMALAIIIGTGVQVLTGNALGHGDFEEVDKIFSSSMTFIAIIGISSGIICYTLSERIAILLGAEGNIIFEVSAYLRGYTIGIPFLLMVSSLMSQLQMFNRQKFTLIVSAIIVVLNLLFSLANLKFFNGDMFGMGLSTSLCQLVVFIIVAIYLAYNRKLFSYSLLKTKLHTAISIFSTGFPVGLKIIFIMFMVSILNGLLLKTGGNIAVASYAVMFNSILILDGIVVGIYQSFLMISSTYYGRRDWKSLQMVFNVAINTSIFVIVIVSIIHFFAAKPLCSIFCNSDEVLLHSVNFTRTYILAFCLDVFFYLITNFNICLKRTKLVTFYFCIRFFFFAVWAFLGSKMFGIVGIWLSYSVQEIAILIFIFISKSIKLGRMPRKAIDMVELDTSSDYESKLNFEIKNISESVNISEKIIDFCLDCGASRRIALHCGLCAEEVIVNIFKHCKLKRKPTVELFAASDDEDITIYIQDNSSSFDPKDVLEHRDLSDPCKNIGIKIISRISTEMKYQNSFGSNLLMIKLRKNI